jgi:hypothetical protein
MTKLLIFLAVQFYGALAIYSVAALVERRREMSQEKTEPVNDVRPKMAA